jgi:hypothetical protein
VRIRVVAKAASVVALVVAILIGWWSYAFFGHRRVSAQNRPAAFRDSADILLSKNAPLILWRTSQISDERGTIIREGLQTTLTSRDHGPEHNKRVVLRTRRRDHAHSRVACRT